VTGTLEPARQVEVGSQVSGTIASIEVDFNSRIKAGQLLARLDPASFQAHLAEVEAGLAKARAERARLQAALEDARRKLEQAQALASDQQLARAELDLAHTTMLQAEADARSGEAQIAAAMAIVRQARVSLDDTLIRSPIDGLVIVRHVEVGQTIAASVNAPVLFMIGDLRRMRLLAEVPEGEVGGMQPGSQVQFAIEALGATEFTGTVAEIRLAPQVVQAAASGAGTGATAVAATAGSSQAESGGTRQPASSTTTGGAASQPTAQTTAPNLPATPASTPAPAATLGVVSYVAVIDVDAVSQDIPPGGTAIVTLAGSERPQAVRIPNNALTFAPSPEVLAAVDQDPPALNRSNALSPKRKTQEGYVWKFENYRFVPIAVTTGITDDSWTELVAGDVRTGDRLLTAATKRKR
jgi:multidrug efflux pump subunit AcrA (membrane-fusion protein)